MLIYTVKLDPKFVKLRSDWNTLIMDRSLRMWLIENFMPDIMWIMKIMCSFAIMPFGGPHFMLQDS
jgi:hypothetical protein